MSQDLGQIEQHLERMALEMVTLEGGDIQGMGKIMNALEAMEERSKSVDMPVFRELTTATERYLERLILAEETDMSPLEEAIGCLQDMFRAMDRKKRFKKNIRALLERLLSAAASDERTETEVRDQGLEGAQEVSQKAKSNQIQKMTEEDRQILSDFVSESLENLASIEVNLIDLEDDPEDLETINAIFRPFHTIKGVSGFLNLGKINKLAHSAENLLDKARDGEIKIEESVVDLVLESVDMLKRMIQGVEEGVEKGICEDNGVDITPLVEKIEAFRSKSDSVSGKPLGEILLEKGVISEKRLQDSLETQKHKPNKKLGEILVEEGAANLREVVGALRSQRKFGAKKVIDLQVKVDTKKLDTLVDMTGELVIAQSMLRQNETILSVADQKLYHTLNQLNQITSTLQKTAMSMRMVPIRSTFQKMVRLVRDLSKSSGKQIALSMVGEDTEIDRNVVDELYEPMVHMIRNAVDHGIESPEERERSGKPSKGVVELRAFHRGGNIVIEIEDDGRGLDRNGILEKAKEVGLVTGDESLSDSEIYNLIFRPGFSTAKEVTDISGRGVGMDVVKKAFEKLRGRIEINSNPSQGSIFTISLPLTLAIIEGMVVRVGQERYIIPALAILESFRPERSQYSTVKGRGEMVTVRGKIIPLIRLDRIVRAEGKCQDPCEGLVVAVEYEGQQMCLLLDELLGKEEVVIKSLGESLKHVKGLAGGAIMGDGRVGLILDIGGIFEIAREGY